MPKDYVVGAVQDFYGGWRAKVDRAEAHIIEFWWNGVFFMLRESKAQKPRPVGLNDSIDRGIVSDTTCLLILRDIGVFKNPEHESQKSRPAGQDEKRAQAMSVENGLE